MNQPDLNHAFAALADPARRALVLTLARGPQTAGALAEPFAISRPAISRHLRVLREAGLVAAHGAAGPSASRVETSAGSTGGACRCA